MGLDPQPGPRHHRRPLRCPRPEPSRRRGGLPKRARPPIQHDRPLGDDRRGSRSETASLRRRRTQAFVSHRRGSIRLPRRIHGDGEQEDRRTRRTDLVSAGKHADSEKVTGNKRKYDIQRRTDDGWESIHWVSDKYGYNDVGISHSPRTGFAWTFPFSRNGLEQSTQFNTPYSVCEDLAPGDYRFVYWGVGSEAERESNYEKEYAVGVRFSVVRS